MDIACELGLGLGLRLIHFAKVYVQSTKEFWFSLRENLEERRKTENNICFVILFDLCLFYFFHSRIWIFPSLKPKLKDTTNEFWNSVRRKKKKLFIRWCKGLLTISSLINNPSPIPFPLFPSNDPFLLLFFCKNLPIYSFANFFHKCNHFS